jgi:hypothetical protein
MTIVGTTPHTFHIPVMGTGFMIDAPLRVARYGITSVISLVDDVLIEQMRQFHSQRAGEPYEPIGDKEDDARARRITAYLDLLDRLVRRQVEALQASPFEPGSEITRYYELLPDGPLARDYRAMLAESDPLARQQQQARLRTAAVPGQIDANIMAKGDRDAYRQGEKLPAFYSDASAALRGFALSQVDGSMVFSAGFNPRLYAYVADFPDFLPDETGRLRKRIVLKVSDYHSAVVQGRFLAKRGVWISEFRIESGLNCGGHAFATRGLLLGPILAEFREKKQELIDTLHAAYAKALGQRGMVASAPLPVRMTVQGGIGTAEEDRLLREHYDADGTGWGTPFLLVPEVTNVGQEHVEKLCQATDHEVYLSDSSPFGLPFWNLRTSASEEARRRRIDEGHPGSPCSKGYVRLFNMEFTPQPICTASRQYQRLKLEQLAAADVPEDRRAALREGVLLKSCICHDLAGGATLDSGIDPKATPAVCCGPNIVNFSRVATLDEMVGHIYGRLSLLDGRPRPHMLLREVGLYIDFLRSELDKARHGLATCAPGYVGEFVANLQAGIDHYRELAPQLALGETDGFQAELDRLEQELRDLESSVEPVDRPDA